MHVPAGVGAILHEASACHVFPLGCHAVSCQYTIDHKEMRPGGLGASGSRGITGCEPPSFRHDLFHASSGHKWALSLWATMFHCPRCAFVSLVMGLHHVTNHRASSPLAWDPNYGTISPTHSLLLRPSSAVPQQALLQPWYVSCGPLCSLPVHPMCTTLSPADQHTFAFRAAGSACICPASL